MAATSETIICNQALAHIKKPFIASLSEQSKAATYCNFLYPKARDFVLQDHDWGFAERRVYGAEITGVEPVGYEYAYEFPADALKIRRIYQEVDGADPIKYIIQAQESLEDKMVITDQYQAILIFTAKIENTNMFSAAFETALSWKLAADLAMPMTGSKQIEAATLQVYQAYIGRAQTLDANESNEIIEVDNPFIAART
jgi:hypothetical protein